MAETELDGGIDAEIIDDEVILSDIMADSAITLSFLALDQLVAFVGEHRKDKR